MAKAPLLYEKTGDAESGMAWGVSRFSLGEGMKIHSVKGKVHAEYVGPQTADIDEEPPATLGIFGKTMLCTAAAAQADHPNGRFRITIAGYGKGIRDLIGDFAECLELEALGEGIDSESRHAFRAYHTNSVRDVHDAHQKAHRRGIDFETYWKDSLKSILEDSRKTGEIGGVYDA